MSGTAIHAKADYAPMWLFGGLSLATCIAIVLIVCREATIPLLIGTLAVGVVVTFLRHPESVLYVLVGLGPFYDLARSFFFPGVGLLGFWQDVLVVILGVIAVRNVARNGFPQLTTLDKFVVAYVVAYTLSIVASSNLSIWFYGYRWAILYPVMYLVLRTIPCGEIVQRKIVLLVALSITLSGVLGLLAVRYLGWDAISDLYIALGRVLMSRNDEWRWPATFMNAIFASIAFALLFIAFAVLARFEKHRWPWVIGCCFALYCLYLTRSRSGVVIATAGFTSLLVARKAKYYKAVLCLGLIVALAMAAHVVGTLDEFDVLRVEQFSRTISESITHYPFGTGAGTSGAVSFLAASFAGQDPDRVDFVVGDSMAMIVLRDTGWFGFLSYVGICLAAIVVAWRSRTTLVGQLTLAVWIGSAVNLMNATDVYPIRAYLWILLALTSTARPALSQAKVLVQHSD